ncbi:tetratricopeptide repeat protein, partial [Burkholderia pyrrocinia]|uniref:tetratricopeptide repeat protein n=1 Tax=Burkholderia pyrrocinia TaxID=60550 RepID=UPI0010F16301
YAKLRCGDVPGARVPLMKAIELNQNNPKIVSNLALYLLVSGRAHDAQKLMSQQKLSTEIRNDIRSDATRIAAAARTWRRPSSAPAAAAGSGSVVDVSGSNAAQRASPVASIQGFDQTAPMLQR